MSYQRIIVSGNLARDPEIRHTPSGAVVCTLSIPTTEKWRDKAGETQERTEWHRCILWNKTAELAEKYLQKGSAVTIEGKNQTRKWQDKDGQERYTTEVVANDMQMLDSRSGGSAPYEGGGDRSQQGAERPEAGGPPRSGNAPREQGFADDGFDDDIPF